MDQVLNLIAGRIQCGNILSQEILSKASRPIYFPQKSNVPPYGIRVSRNTLRMTKSILTFLLLPVTISVHRYVMIDQFKLLTCEHTRTKQSIVECLNNSDDAPPNSRASSSGESSEQARIALNASRLHLTSPLRT
jgi:hypothetical protein